MKPIFLVCGVPGSGKTWVCRQLAHKAYYIPHDIHYKNHANVLIKAADTSIKPIVTECPFAERILRDELVSKGVTVYPIFVIEEPDLIKKRYEDREKKPFPKNNYTRASSIRDRAKEWEAPFGTSEEVLKKLTFYLDEYC